MNNTAVTGHQEEGQQDGPYVWDEAQQVLRLVMIMMIMMMMMVTRESSSACSSTATC